MTEWTTQRLLAAGKSQVRRIEKRVRRATGTDRPARLAHAPLNDRAVLYEAFSGAGILCHPEAIFRALLAAEDLGHLEHVWVLSGVGRSAAVLAEFANHPRVRFVSPGTADYRLALATSKYLVNNVAFPPSFAKRAGQVYLNTGHGTPVRAVGYDRRGGATATANLVRNLASADYLLAPNEATAELYLTSYRMRNLLRGRLIAEGSPRVDHQFSSGSAVSVRERLRAGGAVVNDGQRIVVYAPTLRGEFASPTNDVRQLQRHVEALRARLDADTYCVLLKLHPQVYQYIRDDPALRAVLVPPELPANLALAAADVLITDYSSIFIDYLASNRPVVFFRPEPVPDESAVLDEWPGPVCTDIDDLAAAIAALDPAAVETAAYAAARTRYCPREDGGASKRVVDIVFRGRTAGYDIRAGFGDGRPGILLSLDSLGPTDVTTAALNLVDAVDYDRFDVTVSYPPSTEPEQQAVIARINPRARQLPRVGPTTDWAGCFGDARFDFAVDFSGSSPAWDRTLLAGRPGSLSIWQHGDLPAEAAKKGRRDGLVEVYRDADHLVSVSPALAEVNRANLSDVGGAKFTYARNTVNGRRVQKLAFGASVVAPAAAQHAATAPVSVGATTLPATMDELLAFHSIDDIREEVWRTATIRTVLPDEPGTRTFVTVGPLSGASNHKRLIRAFDRIHQASPNTRLIIIGIGPLDEALDKLVISLGLASAVIFAGEQDNPYGVMARSDCFVLSGERGGHPMIVLEALVLGLPVVTSAPKADRGPLPDGYGHVVAPSVDALADGMRKFLQGELKPRVFDYEAYNRVAIDEFYRAIGAADS